MRSFKEILKAGRDLLKKPACSRKAPVPPATESPTPSLTKEARSGVETLIVNSLEDLRLLPYVFIIQGTMGIICHNLEYAQKELGIKPLSLAEVLSQINGQTDNLVLFDTADVPITGAGNHWRVLSLDQEKRRGILRLSNVSGTFYWPEVPPVEVPYDLPMFTGLSFHEFTVSGIPTKLTDVVELTRKGIPEGKSFRQMGIEHETFSTYVSDANGVLQPNVRYSSQKNNIPYGTL